MALPLLLFNWNTTLAGGGGYYKKILSTAPANLIGYWRLNETSGTTALDSSSQGNNGAYTGVDLANASGPDGVLVPFFDGANDYCNIYSAAFNTDFNGQEGTAAIWFKVNAAAVWTDGVDRQLIRLEVNGDNYFRFFKSLTNNTIRLWTEAGNVPLQKAITYSSTAWTHLAVTWSLVNDQYIAYINGAQSGVTQTGAGTFTGSLSATLTCIGANSTTPGAVWHGWLAHAAIWNTPLTPTQILALATV